jgi:hypothetical protein
MKKSKVLVEGSILDRISNSTKIQEESKISFMKYVWYMTNAEKKEFLQII